VVEHRYGEHGLVDERPRAHRRRHLKVVCVLATEDGIEQGQPFLNAAPSEPQRLQRRCQLQREFGIRIFATPRECGPQVVDLGFGLLYTLLTAGQRRGVEQHGDRRVVVGLVHPWIGIEPVVRHDPVDQVVDHRGGEVSSSTASIRRIYRSGRFARWSQ
jgi:hypothetical protein